MSHALGPPCHKLSHLLGPPNPLERDVLYGRPHNGDTLLTDKICYQQTLIIIQRSLTFVKSKLKFTMPLSSIITNHRSRLCGRQPGHVPPQLRNAYDFISHFHPFPQYFSSLQYFWQVYGSVTDDDKLSAWRQIPSLSYMPAGDETSEVALLTDNYRWATCPRYTCSYTVAWGRFEQETLRLQGTEHTATPPRPCIIIA